MNGDFIEEEKATISPFDHGYLYGLGVFETIRTYNRQPFLLDEHLERLRRGLCEVHIEVSFSTELVLAIIEKLSSLNGLQDSYIRFNVSAGVGDIGLQTEPYKQPTVIMFQKPLPQMEPLREKEAIILRIPRNTPETTFRLKSHHFFNNVAAKRELGSDPNKEGIFLTETGYLAEGVTSNLFWMKDDELYTPALQTGILNGITRNFIIHLAKQQQINIKEGLYQATELDRADEIFFTNSIQEIVPVNHFHGRVLPGKKGKWVQLLHEKYQQYVK